MIQFISQEPKLLTRFAQIDGLAIKWGQTLGFERICENNKLYGKKPSELFGKRLATLIK